MFDAQEYLAAIEPPTFVAPNGKKYVGRVLSTDEFIPYQVAMREVTAGEQLDWRRLQRVLLRLTRAFFPKPRWRFWERSAASWVRTLPPVGQMRAMWDFMASQGKASGMESVTPTPGILRLLGKRSENPPAASPTAG